MRFENKAGANSGVNECAGKAAQDVEMDEALRDFRLSVCAWSEAAISRPRAAVAMRRSRNWQLATALALGCVLIAGGVSGGIYKHLHRQLAAGWEQHPQETPITVARAVEPDRPSAVQRNQPAREEEEDLLASVDSDVSQQVPAVMEPLAQLMAGDETRQE